MLNHSLTLLTVGMVSVASCAIALFSYFTESCNEIGIDTCDSISKLLSDFNSSMGTLDRETHTNTNINSKEFVDYWLYGTATHINWFDKYCQIG